MTTISVIVCAHRDATYGAPLADGSFLAQNRHPASRRTLLS
jgi:hypothetical protein